MALRTATGLRWVWRFGSRRHPGSDGSHPARSPRSTSRLQTYVPDCPRPAAAVTAADPRRKRSRLRSSQSSAAPRGELRSEPSKIERGDSGGQSAATERRGAWSGSSPFPPPASKPKCEDPRVQSAAPQRRGACPPASLPLAPRLPRVSRGGARPSLTSVPRRTRSCCRGTEAGPHSCPGVRQ